ncbi:hypothetical protein HDV00_010430 [Rhizophlyctis rosea]|nr:hypothetical protein HDV00_010430 [Rhizophlyctis rosea]
MAAKVGSFFQRLVGATSKEPTVAALLSQNFLSKVATSNEQWLSHCLDRPLFHHPTGSRIHLLGVSLLNNPPAAYPSHAVEAYAKLAPRPSTLLLDEHVPRSQYAVALSSSGLDTGAEPAVWQAWAEQNQNLLAATDLPHEWLSAFLATGLRPSWDMTSFLSPEGYISKLAPDENPSVGFIGMTPEEETDRTNSFIIKQVTEDLQKAVADTDGENENGIDDPINNDRNRSNLFSFDEVEDPIDPTEALQSSLRNLYLSVGISSSEIAAIQTGNPLADNKLQSLPLGPAELAAYHRIIARHLQVMGLAGRSAMDPGAAGDAGRRWQRAEAGRVVRHRHLVEEIRMAAERCKPGDIILAVVDRNHDEGVRRLWHQLEDSV